MDKIDRPSNFAFIVGAPRCGTTTIASFLQQHPDVCFSAVKEPHFFTRHDLTSLKGPELRSFIEKDYIARFFGDCFGRNNLRAEGSVTYLYAPERMRPILDLWPNARFIIALRDPVAMLPSLHARLLVTGDETIRDFAKAWAKIDDRAQGKSIPRSAIDPRFLRYDEAAKLGSKVEAFFDAVGRERCHVVLFDDLSTDPVGSYEALCKFLEIEPLEGTLFEPQRTNKTIRIGWLQRLLKRPPRPIRAALAGEQFNRRERQVGAKESRAIAAVFSVRKRLLDWNNVPKPREAVDPGVRREIITRLQSEVILLSRVIDRDLSHWLGGVPEAGPQPKKIKA